MREDGGPRDDEPGDDVTAALAALVDRLRTELAGSATVERTDVPGGLLRVWDVRPDHPRALPVSWIELGEQQIVLQAGTNGGRWELDRSLDDVRFLADVVDAAVAGRVLETSALARSTVVVTSADGQVWRQTGYVGCLAPLLPLPGWRRWGTVTRYRPYA